MKRLTSFHHYGVTKVVDISKSDNYLPLTGNANTNYYQKA